MSGETVTYSLETILTRSEGKNRPEQSKSVKAGAKPRKGKKQKPKS
jgi:hypothetical protein